jgi:hypothetical protein
MKYEFEVRLITIKHMAKMLLEMGNYEFEKLTEAEEADLLEDCEDVAKHLLDSMGFKSGESEDGVSFSAVFALKDPEKYIEEKFAEEAALNP